VGSSSDGAALEKIMSTRVSFVSVKTRHPSVARSQICSTVV